MIMTSRLTHALHVVGMLAQSERVGAPWTTSADLARSMATNAVVVKRLLGDLGRAGLVETKRGRGGGARLARPAASISLADVFDAVREGETLLALYPSGPSPTCEVAPHIERYVQALYADAEARAREAFASRTVADLESDVSASVVRS